MASRAKPVKSSATVETQYRLKLHLFLTKSWKRISNRPDASVEDLMAAIALPALGRFLSAGDRHNLRQMKSALAEIGKVQAQRAAAADVAPVLLASRLRNTALITSMTDQQRRLAVEVLTEAAGEKPLPARLQEALGISKARARLIARDQTSKLNADLTEFRARSAGSPRYEWSSSGDERTRPLHAELDGQIYEWGAPTEAEGGGAPGQPVLCRCVAIALFD